MWAIIVLILNLPPILRHLSRNLQLVGIVPGKAEPSNTDPYLDILVDEIRNLQDTLMFDGFSNTMFPLKIDILQHTLDYPGKN